ncbi:MAG: hypothetical protein R3F59_07220 [Myxococcota bacterium]
MKMLLTLALLPACTPSTKPDPAEPPSDTGSPGADDTETTPSTPTSSSSSSSSSSSTPTPNDADGDGWDADHDCDDSDPTVLGRATVDGVVVGDLQDALDLAVDGSLVTVCAGEHRGPFVATVPVTLVSDDGAAATTLRGANGVRPLAVVGGTTVTGFTISGGWIAGPGGGVLLSAPGSLALTDCVVADNESTTGGGIEIVDGELTLERTVVERNVAEEGGGLRLVRSTATLVDSELSDNEADQSIAGGGGAALVDGVLVGGTVRANHLSGQPSTANGFAGGGGVLLRGTSRLEQAVVTENDGLIGAGVEVLHASAEIVDTEIRANADPNGSGTGLACIDAALTLDGVLVAGNAGAYGGGLYAWMCTVDGSATVEDNDADAGGGAYVIDADLSSVVLSGNRAANLGGGLFAAGAVLQDVTIAENEADYGGGFHSLTASTLTDVVVERNQARVGGGGDGEFDLVRTVVLDNVATERGGGLSTLGTVHLTDGAVLRNTAGLYGGGVLVDQGSLVVVNSDFGDGADDNQPDDVYAQSAYGGYGPAATFTCQPSGC